MSEDVYKDNSASYIGSLVEKRYQLDPVFRSIVYSNIQALKTGRIVFDCLHKAVALAYTLYKEDELLKAQLKQEFKIEQQEPSAGWISVKAQPEKEGEYLTYPRKYETTSFYNERGEYAGEWTRTDENGYDYKVLITHWQPLPKPPEGN